MGVGFGKGEEGLASGKNKVFQAQGIMANCVYDLIPFNEANYRLPLSAYPYEP